jgi:glycerophosphoryl diester phosphodiesterase
VRQTRDHVLVGFHPASAGRLVTSLTYVELCQAAGYEVPRVSELARLLAGRAGAHVDLKEAGSATAAVTAVLAALDPADVVVTTRDPVVAGALSRTAPVGLTIGGEAGPTARFTAQRVFRPGLSRLDAVTACGASWAVVHYRIATPGLLRQARERGLQVMIWTVNGDRALHRWLSGPAADVVVTDQPARALGLRDG